MITVYGRATSSNVQSVMWAIGELGLAHERLDYGHVHGGLDSPGFRKLTPVGRIPVIVDEGGPPIFESGAILRYLAARYAPDAFWPKDPVDRSQIDQWAEWVKCELNAAFTVPVFWARVRTAAAKRDEVALAGAIVALEQMLRLYQAQTDRLGYLAAETLTLADIPAGHILHRYYTMDIPRADLPGLRAYYDRLCQRPAYREHVMVDFSILMDPQA